MNERIELLSSQSRSSSPIVATWSVPNSQPVSIMSFVPDHGVREGLVSSPYLLNQKKLFGMKIALVLIRWADALTRYQPIEQHADTKEQ
jgi:hypothetical protein